MEDLKDRYYSVYRKLILQGKGNDYIPDRQSLAQQYSYDKSKEIERKNALIMLFNRTKEQVEEEEALFVEAKRIELNEAKLSRERESLLNSLQLEQIQQIPSTPNTPLHSNNNNGSSNSNSNNNNSPGGILSSPGGIGITGGTAGGNHSLELKVNYHAITFYFILVYFLKKIYIIRKRKNQVCMMIKREENYQVHQQIYWKVRCIKKKKKN